MSRLASQLIKLTFLIALFGTAKVLAEESENIHWYYQNGVVLQENSSYSLSAGDSLILTCRGKPQSAAYLIFVVTRDAPLSAITYKTNLEAYNLAQTTGLTLSTNDIKTVYDSINGVHGDFDHLLAFGGEFGAGVVSNYFSLQIYVPHIKSSDAGSYYCNTLELTGTAPSASIVTAYSTPYILRVSGKKLGAGKSGQSSQHSQNIKYLAMATCAARLFL